MEEKFVLDDDFYLDDEEEIEDTIDRHEYLTIISEGFGGSDLSDDEFMERANAVIDKTIEQYTNKNGKFIVEDWDMFDQDMYSNACDMFLENE